jgi:hypothetical protein
MRLPWPFRTRGGHPPGRRRARRSRVELTALEDRRLPAIAAVTAVAAPRFLFPPDGQYVPVVVTGSVTQVITYNLPGHQTVAPTGKPLAGILAKIAVQPYPTASIQVTDQYRADEPRAAITLQLTGTRNFFNKSTPANPTAAEGQLRTFSYTSTIFLQAGLGEHSNGRQYFINVYASDSAGGLGANVFTYVPRHLIARAPEASAHTTH